MIITCEYFNVAAPNNTNKLENIVQKPHHNRTIIDHPLFLLSSDDLHAACATRNARLLSFWSFGDHLMIILLLGAALLRVILLLLLLLLLLHYYRSGCY
jgi:hypothetical protein